MIFHQPNGDDILLPAASGPLQTDTICQRSLEEKIFPGKLPPFLCRYSVHSYRTEEYRVLSWHFSLSLSSSTTTTTPTTPTTPTSTTLKPAQALSNPSNPSKPLKTPQTRPPPPPIAPTNVDTIPSSGKAPTCTRNAVEKAMREPKDGIEWLGQPSRARRLLLRHRRVGRMVLLLFPWRGRSAEMSFLPGSSFATPVATRSSCWDVAREVLARCARR